MLLLILNAWKSVEPQSYTLCLAGKPNHILKKGFWKEHEYYIIPKWRKPTRPTRNGHRNWGRCGCHDPNRRNWKIELRQVSVQCIYLWLLFIYLLSFHSATDVTLNIMGSDLHDRMTHHRLHQVPHQITIYLFDRYFIDRIPWTTHP